MNSQKSGAKLPITRADPANLNRRKGSAAAAWARVNGIVRLCLNSQQFRSASLLELATKNERIRLPLFADGGQRPMSGNHDGFVRQRHQRAVQRLHDLLIRAARQVGAAN